METILDFIVAHPELSLLIGGSLADIIAGWLPDKYCRYPGMILSIGTKMYYKGKREAPPEARQTEDLVRRVIRRELAMYAKPKSR